MIDTSNLAAAQLKRLSNGYFARGPGNIRDFNLSLLCRDDSMTIDIGRTAGRHRPGCLAEELNVDGARTELSDRDMPQFGAPGPVPSGVPLAAS